MIYISSCHTDLSNALRSTRSQNYLLRRQLNACLPPLRVASLGIMQMLQESVLSIWNLVIYFMFYLHKFKCSNLHDFIIKTNYCLHFFLALVCISKFFFSIKIVIFGRSGLKFPSFYFCYVLFKTDCMSHLQVEQEPLSWLVGSDVVVIDPPRKGLDPSLIDALQNISSVERRVLSSSERFSFCKLMELVHIEIIAFGRSLIHYKLTVAQALESRKRKDLGFYVKKKP